MEGEAEHRGAADQRAVLGRQRVDPRHRRGLGRVGSPPMPPDSDRGAQQVAQELRVAARALRDDLEHVRRQRAAPSSPAAPCAAHPAARAASSSMRVTLGDFRRGEARGGRGGGRRRTASGARAACPTRCASSSAEASSMWCAFSISTNAGPGHHRVEEARRPPRAASRAGSPRPASRPRASARRRRRTRRAISGSHGSRSGAFAATASRRRASTSASGRRRAESPSARAAARARPRTASTTCRPRRCVQLPEADRGVAHRLEQAGLADARLSPTISTRCPAPERMPPSVLRMTPSSALRPVSGSRLQRHRPRARALRAARPTTPGPARPCP